MSSDTPLKRWNLMQSEAVDVYGPWCRAIEVERLELANRELREAIENAPHEKLCASHYCTEGNIAAHLYHGAGECTLGECNCWKSAALSRVKGDGI